MQKPVGKVVGRRLYVHTSALEFAAPDLIQAVLDASTLIGLHSDTYNVVRLDAATNAIGLLQYPTFFDDAFPVLTQSWKVYLDSKATSYRTYVDSFNPPILHRKELLLAPDDARRPTYERLTAELESLGFFDDPVRIGFKLQWEQLLDDRGFRVVNHALVPVGNEEVYSTESAMTDDQVSVSRHLTALTRYALSAPIQLLRRYGFLDGNVSFFDYGCGKGDDVRGLKEIGIQGKGWDPHYAPDNSVGPADVINLGFVINVIEDPVERREALRSAFALATRVLAVSVMVSSEKALRGTPFADGALTGRNTFQKYYTQGELREYLEATLGEAAVAVAPGIAFVFKNKLTEQRFQAGRFRSALRTRSAMRLPRTQRMPCAPQARTLKPDLYEQHRKLLDELWRCHLDLGRQPESEEVPQYKMLEDALGSFRKSLRFVLLHHDAKELDAARSQRTNDLRVYFALQHFQKRQPYQHLEARLKRDVKAFFGTYVAAQGEGRTLLTQASQAPVREHAAREAAEQGLGWLSVDGYLYLHSALVDRLPPVLRTYIGCASMLYGDVESVDLVKIHLGSGKVSLMAFQDFAESPLPRMTRRVKINLLTQSVRIFEYGDEYAPPFLYLKSRFLNEECSFYAEQVAFDDSLEKLDLFDLSAFGPSPQEFIDLLRDARWCVNGYRLERAHYTPDLDAMCGRFFTYRQLIECGDTQHRLALPNLPREPESYTALYDLATKILDPVIEYFGAIELTYGFCSAELGRNIRRLVAPHLDQHAAHERKRSGAYICDRMGAAVDFLVRDENMSEVADWAVRTLPFDRMYYYGIDRPLHISFGPDNKREVVDVTVAASGRRVPRVRRVSPDQMLSNVGRKRP